MISSIVSQDGDNSGTSGEYFYIYGDYFVLGQTDVSFNPGVAAQLDLVSDTLIIVTIPAGAADGPVSVSTPNGTAAFGPGGGGPGPLVSALTGKFLSNLRIPLTLVPDNLSEEELAEIA